VLVLATAATAEVLTLRFDAIRRGLEDAQRPREGDAFLAADFFYQCAFAGKNKRRKNCTTGMEAESFAAINEFYG
jgi:hypothetical protein